MTRIAKTSNGLTLIADDSRAIVLCWDGDVELLAGSGDPMAEIKHMTDSELRQIMNSAEQWQADNENLRSTALYQQISAYMQDVKWQLKARILTAWPA